MKPKPPAYSPDRTLETMTNCPPVRSTHRHYSAWTSQPAALIGPGRSMESKVQERAVQAAVDTSAPKAQSAIAAALGPGRRTRTSAPPLKPGSASNSCVRLIITARHSPSALTEQRLKHFL